MPPIVTTATERKHMSNTIGFQSVSLRKYMQSRAFSDGFNDARSGKAWRADEYEHNAVPYEHGRQLAVCNPYLERVKNGRSVCQKALLVFWECLDDSTIV